MWLSIGAQVAIRVSSHKDLIFSMCFSICNAMIFQTTYDGESKCNVVINCHHAINSMIHINIGFYDFELYILLS